MSALSGLDMMEMYRQFDEFKPGPKAEIRRVVSPTDLTGVPAYFRLLQGRKGEERIRRVIYCLPYVKHKEGAGSLGKALGKSDLINERRLFQVVRSESPLDLIRFRRLLQQIKPVVDWSKAVKEIYFWNDLSKQNIIEDYFYYKNSKSVKVTKNNVDEIKKEQA